MSVSFCTNLSLFRAYFSDAVTFSSRLATNIKAADKTPQTQEQFDLGLDEFMAWVGSTENSLDRLSEETSKTDVLENKDLCTFYLEEFRVSLLHIVIGFVWILLFLCCF